jgi:hypothetical protein
LLAECVASQKTFLCRSPRPLPSCTSTSDESYRKDQIRAYILADNKLNENAGWDQSILAIELQHLVTVDLGFDVSVTGFEVPKIDLILQQAESKPGPAISCPGDLWLLNKHRIYCGNPLLTPSISAPALEATK